MIASIPPRQFSFSEPFAFWEDFLTESEINQLLNLPQWKEIQNGSVGGDAQNFILANVRHSQVAWFFPCKETKVIWEKITNTIAEVNRKFFGFDLTGCYEAGQLSLYVGSEQGHYDWHIDMSEKTSLVPRKLSMSLLLSDPADFQGGELQIKTAGDEPQNVEQSRGRAWFFPSYTLHRVAPVTKGVRRSLVLWVGGPPFR
jgi:PKHD-type hydroxylase